MSLDPALKISLSLTIFEALVNNLKRGEKKTEEINFACLFVCFYCCKRKKKKFTGEREREKSCYKLKRERE
jgi:hypothetical protein